MKKTTYHNDYTGFDPFIIALIARSAQSLCGRYGFGPSDIPDHEQELHIAIVLGLDARPPGVSLEAAAHQIVASRIKDLIRHRQAACRDWHCEAFSMDAPPPGRWDDNDPLGENLDLDACIAEVFGQPSQWHTRRAETIDTKDALSGLPKDCLTLALALEAADGNLSEAARMAQLPRKKARTVREKLRQRTSPILRAKPSAPSRKGRNDPSSPRKNARKKSRKPDRNPQRHDPMLSAGRGSMAGASASLPVLHGLPTDPTGAQGDLKAG